MEFAKHAPGSHLCHLRSRIMIHQNAKCVQNFDRVPNLLCRVFQCPLVSGRRALWGRELWLVSAKRKLMRVLHFVIFLCFCSRPTSHCILFRCCP